MKIIEQSFGERKDAALSAARAQGIVDVVQASGGNGVSLEALEQATKLTEKYAPALFKGLEEKRRAQK